MSEMPLETLIEATLFSSGKSMSVEELSTVLGYDEDEMLDCLGSLQATLRRRKGGALQLAEVGDRWALEVKPAIANHLPRETKTDMPPKLLKAAALIAYHQPMPQSRLVELLGQKAYDYVRELAQLGMVPDHEQTLPQDRVRSHPTRQPAARTNSTLVLYDYIGATARRVQLGPASNAGGPLNG